MGIKVKKLKEAAPTLDLGIALMLMRSVPMLKVPTYNDVQRIEGIIKKLSEVNQIHQKSIKDFFEQNSLPDDEHIDASHPLFYELNAFVSQQKTSISKNETSLFTLKEFNQAIDGSDIRFSERSFMQFWLVKED